MGLIESAGKTAIIIGAGPAGLTAAYELITRAGVKPVVLEMSDAMGGISRTVNYKGNRMDIGGHRFFSKSDRVMQWWLQMLPLDPDADRDAAIRYHRMERALPESPAPADPDRMMLLRPRKSRIYYLRGFFDYPITLSANTIARLGPARTLKIGFSYIRSALFPIRDERTLEDFFINRFGRELYLTFFKSYTEKVWGVPCTRISAEWGAQRIKGLSIRAAVAHAIRKGTETSLIDRFLYPKYGPGQMWDEVARRVVDLGGEIHVNCRAGRFEADGNRITAVEAGGRRFTGDYFFSTAPIQELMRSLSPPPPPNVLEVSDGLVYRDFITVGLLLDKLKIHDQTPQGSRLIRDNWIYIQEADVRLGRLQVFNNWSPALVADPGKVWLGLEYFCNQTDALWTLPDGEMIALAKSELAKIGIIDAGDVLDGTVIRMPKTYPAYFGTYGRFGEIRDYVDRFDNLVLIGRNGMHRYNNQDHSMLTAMMAVDGIIAGRIDRAALWEVNTEMEYHEEK